MPEATAEPKKVRAGGLNRRGDAPLTWTLDYTDGSRETVPHPGGPIPTSPAAWNQMWLDAGYPLADVLLNAADPQEGLK